MSLDFFHRLAAAAVEPSAKVRTRTVSRFEPIADHASEEEES